MAEPATSNLGVAPRVRRKLRPRGRPFAKGNTVGPRFAAGASGNPAGHPKSFAELRVTCQSYADLAVSVLVTAMRTPRRSHRLAVEAAREVLDRGYGRASAEVKLTAEARPATATAWDLSVLSAQDLEDLLRLARAANAEILDVPTALPVLPMTTEITGVNGQHTKSAP